MHRTKNVESVEEQERVLPRVSIKSWISDLGPQLSDLIRPIRRSFRGANHEASINEVVTLTSWVQVVCDVNLSGPALDASLQPSPSLCLASLSVLRQPQDYEYEFIY